MKLTLKMVKLSLLLIIAMTTTMVQAQTYELLMYEGYPPFSYGESEQPKGLFYEIVKHIIDQSDNIDANFRVLPWSRALDMTKRGEGYLVGLLKTEERLKLLNYSESFYDEALVLYKSQADKTDYSSGVKSLTGKVVGMNRNWSYGKEFDAAKEANLFTIDDAKDDKANLRKLSAGRIDVAPINRLTGQMLVKELKLESSVVQASDPIDLTPVFVATGKDNDSSEFFDNFNAKLKELKENGKLAEFILKYENQLLN